MGKNKRSKKKQKEKEESKAERYMEEDENEAKQHHTNNNAIIDSVKYGGYAPRNPNEFDDRILDDFEISDEEREEYKENLYVDLRRLKKRLSLIYQNKKCINVTIVAEKPSIGRKIAVEVSKGNFKLSNWCNFKYYTFIEKYLGFRAKFTIISTFGHIYKTHFENRGESLFRRKPDELLSYPLYHYYISNFGKKKSKKKSKKPQPDLSYIEDYLYEFLTGSDMVLLWLDNDISGENIWFQLIDFIEEFVKDINIKNILRAEFSSLASPDIQAAYEAMQKKPNFYKSEGFNTRAIIDLRLGMSFTVFQSQKLKSILGSDIKWNNKYSYGPCLFPTLYFCIQRAKKVRSFEPRKYWKVIVTLQIDEDNTIEVEHVRQFESFEKAKEIMGKITKMTWIDSYSKFVSEKKPEPLNTTGLLTLSSKQLGFSVK